MADVKKIATRVSYGEALVELANEHDDFVVLDADLAAATQTGKFKAACPDRFFDVGIAEGHAVTFSAGMAAAGMVPFCNIYSSFMQRAYDNVIHDVAIQDLPVVMCLDRGGIVGEDGVTHHGVFDMAAFGAVPGLTIAAPMDELELRNMMYTGLQYGHPFMIRYPRGNGAGRRWRGVPFEALPTVTAWPCTAARSPPWAHLPPPHSPTCATPPTLLGRRSTLSPACPRASCPAWAAAGSAPTAT